MNSHDSLVNYFNTNFNLMYHFGEKNFNPLAWDEKLMPWEKAIYVEMLMNKVKEQEEASKKSSGGELWDPQSFGKMEND